MPERGVRPVAGAARAGRRAARGVASAVEYGRQHLPHAGETVVAGVRVRTRTSRGRVLLGILAVLLVGLPTAAGFGIAALVGDDGRSGPPRQIAKIGLVVPLSGELAEVGTAVRNAVQLAIEESNETEAVPGWTLELAVYDDLSRPDGGAAAASGLAGDDAVVGVVGPLSSTVATVALPTLSDAGIAVVSPSNGRADLTGHGDDPRDRPFSTYFRLVGTDDLQARAAAEYLVNTLGRSRVAVVDSGLDYGDSLAGRFAGALRAVGGEVVSFRSVGDGDDELAELVDELSDDAPDAVYLDTGPDLAGQVRNRLADVLPSVPVVGTDALLGTRYLEAVDAPSAAEGDLVTELGAPVSELPGAGAFVAAYAKRWFAPLPEESEAEPDDPADSADAGPGVERSSAPEVTALPGQDTDGAAAGSGATDRTGAGRSNVSESSSASAVVPSPTQTRSVAERWTAEALPSVAAYSYDAARALVRAAGVVLPGRSAVDEAARSAMVAAVARGSFAGVTGRVAFDRWGDPQVAVATVYTVLGDRFVPLKIVR